MQRRRAIPASSLTLPLLALALLAARASGFSACVARDAPGATLSAAGASGFRDAVSKSLYPSPDPGFVVAVTEESHVSAVVQCAVASGVPLCMRGGGHSFTGKGMGGAGCALVDVRGLQGFDYDAALGTVTLGAGNTLGEMFLKTFQATRGGGLVGIGLCPSVGIAGYLLGGGFNPYSASIGLTCESVQEFRFVLADGQEVKANSGGNTELFWASCGGGGGAFGVLTSVVIQTRDAAKFNQNVYFKYQWPEGVAGEVAHKAVNYDDEDGNLWVRIEFNLGQGATAYGVCWASGSVGDCEERLGQNAFYNVPGRSKVVAKAGADVTEYQKFIGPAGDWASTVPTMSNQQAFINTYGAEAGLGPSRSYNSMFVRYNSVPPQSVFDNMASTFFSLDRSVVAFNLIQFNPWRGAEKSSQPQFSFPHRDSDQLIEFIGGANSGNVDAGLAELRRGNAATQAAIAPWRSGIYINYPQFELADDEYPALYHGSSLPRLSALRGSLDPTGVFRQKQQIPGSGGGGAAVRSVVRSSDAAGQCSGLVALKSTGGLVEGKIHAYPFGYLSGVRAAVRVSAGCALRSPRGAGLATAAERPHHYEVLSEGGHEWSMEMVGEGCELSVVSVNRIECGME